MFWAKKFITFWLLPVPLCLLLLVAGIALLCLTRRARLARGLLIAGAVLLLLFSNKVFSTWLVRPLEQKYPPIPEVHVGAPPPAVIAACRYVIVLGSGHSDTPGFSATQQLTPYALERIVEGVRVLHALPPEVRLIVSGPGVGDNPTHAVVLARAAESLGIDPRRIQRIEDGRDTEGEAASARRLVGEAPIALVTSAWHMPRALALFRKAGVNAIPCPADYTALENADFRWVDLTWDTASLERSTWAMRERIGYLWAWLRGKV